MSKPSSGSCFHEPSDPQPQARVYLEVANRYADKLVGYDLPGAAVAVAQETFRQVLQREPPTKWIATYDLRRTIRRRPCQASVDSGQMTPYARKVDLQLAWNRARPAMVSAGSRWVNYDADPEFANWLSGYNRKWRLGFEHRYLPFFHEQRSGQGLRPPEVAPMPEDILHACFKSCRWEPRSSAGGRQSSVMAHLVAMTCQRLLAYHSARNAVYGQYHVVRLLRLLRTRRGRPEFTWEPAPFFDSVVDGPLVVESGKPEVWLQRFVPETRKVIEKATIAMATPETAWARLKRLLPNRLFVQHACGHCRAKEGTRVQAVEAQLPLFGPRCCCRIEWRSSRRRELQRRVELWAFEVALSPNEPAPCPVGDFLRLGAELDWFCSYCDSGDV